MRKKEHVEEHELELKRMELHCYAASCVMVNRPPKRVIYYLHDAVDRLIYVGQTVTFWNRVKGHEDKPWARAYLRELPTVFLDVVESIEIRRYLPELNGNFGNAGKVAGQIQSWLGYLPSVDTVVASGTWRTLAEAWSSGCEMWMDEDGRLAYRHPRNDRVDDVASAMKTFESWFAV